MFRLYGSKRNQGSQPDVKSHDSHSHLSIICLNHLDYLYRQRLQHTYTKTASTQEQQKHKHTHTHTQTQKHKRTDTCRKKIVFGRPRRGPHGAHTHTQTHT
jgi:hypothetical protein